MDERMTTAGVLIENGKILLAKRSVGHGTNGLWELPGGRNRWGESLEETLVREFDEELSIKIKVGKELGCVDFENNGTAYHLHAFLINTEEFEKARIIVHSEFRFVSKDEILSYDLVPSDRRMLEMILPSL